MPGKEHQRRQGDRRTRRLRHVVLAAMLAILASVLVAGTASADGWPHDNTAPAGHYHHR
jgi:hypothetical protein